MVYLFFGYFVNDRNFIYANPFGVFPHLKRINNFHLIGTFIGLFCLFLVHLNKKYGNSLFSIFIFFQSPPFDVRFEICPNNDDDSLINYFSISFSLSDYCTAKHAHFCLGLICLLRFY